MQTKESVKGERGCLYEKRDFDFYSYLRISGTQAAARRREAEKAGFMCRYFCRRIFLRAAICPVRVVRMAAFVQNIRKNFWSWSNGMDYSGKPNSWEYGLFFLPAENL